MKLTNRKEDQNMKHDEKWGQDLIWASVGLLGVNCLLLRVSFSPDMYDYNKVIWYVVEISLIVIEVSLVYLVVRKFFGKKK